MVIRKFRVIPRKPQTPIEVIVQRDMLAAQRVRNINVKFDVATKKITRRTR